MFTPAVRVATGINDRNAECQSEDPCCELHRLVLSEYHYIRENVQSVRTAQVEFGPKSLPPRTGGSVSCRRQNCPGFIVGLCVLSLCLICSTLLSAQGSGGRILGRVSRPEWRPAVGSEGGPLPTTPPAPEPKHRPTRAATIPFLQFRWAPTRSTSTWRDSKPTFSKASRSRSTRW